MKTKITTLFYALAFIALGFVVASFAMAGTPKQVAEAFLSAIDKKNYEEAKKYATEETKSIIDIIALGDDPNRPVVVQKRKYTQEYIEADKAMLHYKIEGQSKNSTINLLKVKGEWLVNITKDDISDDSEDN